MDTNAFIVRFWGTRGSYPVPGPHTVHYGGNTTCVEIQVGRHTLIIDSGTGIINLGRELVRYSAENGNRPIHITLLFTHTHHDHTQGFPFFAPALIGKSTLNILGPHTFEQSLDEVLHTVVLTPNFPVSLKDMPSLKVFHSLRANQALLIGPETGHIRICNVYLDYIDPSPELVRVRILKSYAHPGSGVYVYRVEWQGRSVVFASDTEGYTGVDRRLAAFANQTDLLIHDAQYTQEDYLNGKQGWGHSTPEMACEVARMSNARRLVLFHHDPLYDDEKVAEIERAAQQLFQPTIAAYEGLEIVL